MNPLKSMVVATLVFASGCAASTGQVKSAKPSKSSGATTTAEVPGLTDRPAPSPVEVHEEMYPDGKTLRVRAEAYTDENGRQVRHGMFTLYWENGNKKTQVAYLHGVQHGPRTSWYQDGQIWISASNFNGGSDGTWTVWFPSGQKAQEKNFRHGAFHGRSREWYSDGILKHEYHMVNGERQGLETKWDKTGAVREVLEYVDDILQP